MHEFQAGLVYDIQLWTFFSSSINLENCYKVSGVAVTRWGTSQCARDAVVTLDTIEEITYSLQSDNKPYLSRSSIEDLLIAFNWEVGSVEALSMIGRRRESAMHLFPLVQEFTVLLALDQGSRRQDPV